MEQVYLRCSAGTVEWMYPTGALIVNLRPNTFSPSRHLTLCIKPLRGSSGANIYLEKTGELKLLVRDGDLGPGQAPCFGFEQGGLFVEATPQQDISRRTTGFQYELTSRRAGPDLHALSGECGMQGVGVASGRSSPVCWACPASIISCPAPSSHGKESRCPSLGFRPGGSARGWPRLPPACCGQCGLRMMAVGQNRAVTQSWPQYTLLPWTSCGCNLKWVPLLFKLLQSFF